MENELIKTINDVDGKQLLVIRADITMKELMEEKPASRWDPGYWDPKYTEIDDLLLSSGFEIKSVGDFEKLLTYGPIVTGREFIEEKDGLLLINQGELGHTGLDTSNSSHAKISSVYDTERSRPQKGDLLLARSGAGGVGKNRISIFTLDVPANIGSFVDLLRVEGINPYFLLVFWKSIFGRNQIEKIINGVGTPNINFDEIRSIKVPIIPVNVQENIEKVYSEISKFHTAAIAAKISGNKAEYEQDIKIAEEKMNDLIARTEALVRGERKDVL